MEFEFDQRTINQIIHNIVYTWSVEEVFYFLEFAHIRNFDVNMENIWGNTALEMIVMTKSVYGFKKYSPRSRLVMKLLLKYGANPLRICYTDETILWYIASFAGKFPLTRKTVNYMLFFVCRNELGVFAKLLCNGS